MVGKEILPAHVLCRKGFFLTCSALTEVKAVGLISLFITKAMPRALSIKQSGLSCIKDNFGYYLHNSFQLLPFLRDFRRGETWTNSLQNSV